MLHVELHYEITGLIGEHFGNTKAVNYGLPLYFQPLLLTYEIVIFSGPRN